MIGLHGALKFNGGGHLNHSILGWGDVFTFLNFIRFVCRPCAQVALMLAEAITRDFGSCCHEGEAVSQHGGCAGLRLGVAGLQQGQWYAAYCYLFLTRYGAN